MQPSVTFCDQDLARRLERAEGAANARFVEARALAFPDSGACWIEVDGAWAMYDAPNSPSTQSFGLGLFADATQEQLQSIEDFFRSRGAPVVLEIAPFANSLLWPLLAARDYQPIEFTTVLFRKLDVNRPPDLDAPVQVRRVKSTETARWADIMRQGWSHVTEFGPMFADLEKMKAHRRDSHSFFAEIDGRPVATGELCLHEGVALLGGACTIPADRRRGAQTALLDERLRFAAESGCDLAMMCAQPGSQSQRNAERHGFRVAYTRTKWQRAKPAEREL